MAKLQPNQNMSALVALVHACGGYPGKVTKSGNNIIMHVVIGNVVVPVNLSASTSLSYEQTAKKIITVAKMTQFTMKGVDGKTIVERPLLPQNAPTPQCDEEVFALIPTIVKRQLVNDRGRYTDLGFHNYSNSRDIHTVNGVEYSWYSAPVVLSANGQEQVVTFNDVKMNPLKPELKEVAEVYYNNYRQARYVVDAVYKDHIRKKDELETEFLNDVVDAYYPNSR